MEINNNLKSPVFKSKVMPTKAAKEAAEYAETLGIHDLLNDVNKSLKFKNNYKLNVRHRYSKPFDTSKTEIRYEHNGVECKYTEMSSIIKNPAELTLKILLDLKNNTGKAFQDIFG